MSRFIRTFRCLSCGRKWQRTQERTEPYPDCPSCGTAQIQLPERIAAPSIVTTKGRAIDVAYDIVSSDYGLTNLKDNAREGESSVVLPPTPPPPDPRTITSPQMIWGGAAPAGNRVHLPSGADALALGRGAAALAKAEGKNPMQLLHSAKPKLQAFPVNRE